MLGIYVYTDKGFYLSFEYSVCKLVKIVLKIMWTACMKIWVLWKAAFAGLNPFPLWELLKFDFLEISDKILTKNPGKCVLLPETAWLLLWA